MATPSTNPNDVIQAAGLTPAFLGAFQAAPPSITIGGQTYNRDDCRNAQERCWYLAALSLTGQKGARAVYRLAHQGVEDMARGFDESQVTSDPDVVTALADQQQKAAELAAAQGAVTDTTKAVRDQQRGLAQIQTQFQNAKAAVQSWTSQLAEVQQAQSNPASGNFGQVFLKIASGIGTGGISNLIDQGSLSIKANNITGQLRNAQNAYDLITQQINTVQTNLAQAQQDQQAAQQALGAAKTAKDAADRAVTKAKNAIRQRLRQAEEQARQEQQQELAQEAADRQSQAMQDYQSQQASAGDYSGYGDYYGDTGNSDGSISPDWGSQDFASSDPNADIGDTTWFDEQADLWGDEDYARQMADLTDEPIIGVNTVVSPYEYDGYYKGYDLEQDPVWGADTGTLVTGIIAGVLAAAPAIIHAVAPPPSKDATGAQTNVGASSQVDVKPLLSSLGLNVDAEATKAGDAAGANVSHTITNYFLIGGVVLAVILIAKKSG